MGAVNPLSAGGVEVELDGQVGAAEGMAGVGEGLGFVERAGEGGGLQGGGPVAAGGGTGRSPARSVVASRTAIQASAAKAISAQAAAAAAQTQVPCWPMYSGAAGGAGSGRRGGCAAPG